MPDRRQADIEWKAHVDLDLSTMNARFTTLEGRMTSLETGLANNTALTAARAERIETKLDAHRERTAPIAEAIETMEAGIRFLGKIGAGAGKVASWWGRLLRLWSPVLGAWAGVVATGVAVWLAFRDELSPYVQAFRLWWHR